MRGTLPKGRPCSYPQNGRATKRQASRASQRELAAPKVRLAFPVPGERPHDLAGRFGNSGGTKASLQSQRWLTMEGLSIVRPGRERSA
jgi:hypothetical protein